jgi:hypothetical protein
VLLSDKEALEFAWFKEVAHASDTIKRAHDFIVGGPLTATLMELGDTFAASAVEHLRQAAQSTAPRERVLQAAATMQDAYFLYEKSAGRGVLGLRQIVDLTQLSLARSKASGCAASIALMQWSLDESPQNVQSWLLRTKAQLKGYDDDVQASWRKGSFLRGYTFQSGAMGRDKWQDEQELNGLAQAYYSTEQNLLPPELRSVVPLYFRTRAETNALGYDGGLDFERRPELKSRWELIQ